jgi:hypothetical protein
MLATGDAHGCTTQAVNNKRNHILTLIRTALFCSGFRGQEQDSMENI